MDEIQQDVSPPAMVKAIETNLFGGLLFNRYWPQAELHEEAELVWVVNRTPSFLWNIAGRARLSPERVHGTIQKVLAAARKLHVPVNWCLGPSSQPENLGEILEQHGCNYSGASPGMAMDLYQLNDRLQPPDSLTIERAQDEKTMELWGRVAATGFELRDWEYDSVKEWIRYIGFNPKVPLFHYLAWLDGEPVATATLQIAGGTAGIYNVTTLRQARQIGIGTSITLAALHQAKSLGYRIAILQSSEEGYEVYRRVGFQEYCKIRNYLWEVDQW